ncbi:MAG: penicillin-binding protein [Acidobacteria bacterium]|nr:MAG: penicillin-binding protein [Acidobacteriota bacterium]
MKKTLVVLIVALTGLLGFDFLPGGGLPQGLAAARPTAIHRRVTHSRRRHVRRRWSPWLVSSYDHDPGAGDNTEGEDLAVRQAALQALGNLNGSIVVVDPNDGRILTVVNQKMAFSGAFRPCSTFKPIVALAALKQGIITTDTKLYVGRRSRIDVTDALAHSNNRFFYKLGQMVGFPVLARYAREFGLGQKAGLDIQGDLPGEFPADAPAGGEVGYLAYLGKGIEVTPLQWAAVASAIANGGTLYYLQYPRTQEQLDNFQPQVRRQLSDLQSEIPEVRAGMAAAVSYGTARSASENAVQILGKTGTCSEDGARLGWFLSYSDARPQYVVVVLLRGGRPMDGPHAAEIAGRLYEGLQQAGPNEIRETKALLGE